MILIHLSREITNSLDRCSQSSACDSSQLVNKNPTHQLWSNPYFYTVLLSAHFLRPNFNVIEGVPLHLRFTQKMISFHLSFPNRRLNMPNPLLNIFYYKVDNDNGDAGNPYSRAKNPMEMHIIKAQRTHTVSRPKRKTDGSVLPRKEMSFMPHAPLPHLRKTHSQSPFFWNFEGRIYLNFVKERNRVNCACTSFVSRILCLMKLCN